MVLFWASRARLLLKSRSKLDQQALQSHLGHDSLPPGNHPTEIYPPPGRRPKRNLSPTGKPTIIRESLTKRNAVFIKKSNNVIAGWDKCLLDKFCELWQQIFASFELILSLSLHLSDFPSCATSSHALSLFSFFCFCYSFGVHTILPSPPICHSLGIFLQ